MKSTIHIIQSKQRCDQPKNISVMLKKMNKTATTTISLVLWLSGGTFRSIGSVLADPIEFHIMGLSLKNKSHEHSQLF